MEEDVKESKPEIPTKSSLEILSELFSSFHAEPPLIIKEEKSDSSKKHKKKKKHKHKERKHKKKDKKKTKSKSGSSCDNESGSEVDLGNILIKHEKDATEKKIKIEGTDLAVDIKLVKLKKEEKGSGKVNGSSKKIIIKDLKHSSILDTVEKTDEGELSDSDKYSGRKHRKKHKYKHSRSKTRSSSRDRKKPKIDDLRQKINIIEKKYKHVQDKSKYNDRISEWDRNEHKSYSDDFYKGYKDRSRTRSRSRDRDKYHDRDRDNDYSRNRTKTKDDDFYRGRDREDKSDKWSSRDRYRSYNERNYRRETSSRSYDSSTRFDKKKLLEIARKNAISMMKSGSLPAALTLGPQAQEKVIAAIKSGGKTIEELTDFCKTLSKKEELGELSSLSEKDDSESDNDKPFHHPFQIKDRPTSITMNIKNSIPLPLKSSIERTSELRMQFPVSSGQQHRKGEEWLPVSPPSPKRIEEKVETLLPVSNIPLPNVPLPVDNSNNLETVHHHPNLPQPVTILTASGPIPAQQVIHTPAADGVDISSIVSKRLTAMRKLQENPNDVQALSQMYKTNKEMQTWATSKQQLGQFTGSTGVQVLSQAELSSGFQAWAKKDQLQSAAPLSGGMGMHLLQKMGWKPGEGLGKEKTGALEPLLLEVKLDKKGLVANEEQKGRKLKQKTAVPVAKSLQGKHPVSLLGEYASKRKLGAPQYILEFECGPDHQKNFLFKVILNGLEYKPSIASHNKKEAKAAAATICLQQIGLLLPTAPLNP